MGTVNYHRSGEIIEIVIRDHNGAKIETHRCSMSDRKKYKSILKYLEDKFGFRPEIDVDESVNAQEEVADWWS